MATPKMKKKVLFRVLDQTFWKTCAKLTDHRDVLVLAFLEGGPSSHQTGLFSMHLIDVCRYTLLTEKEVRDSINKLSKHGLIVFDPFRSIVYVKGMASRQYRTNDFNDTQLAGLCYHAERMEDMDSPAVDQYIHDLSEAYDDAAIFFGGESSLDDAG